MWLGSLILSRWIQFFYVKLMNFFLVNPSTNRNIMRTLNGSSCSIRSTNIIAISTSLRLIIQDYINIWKLIFTNLWFVNFAIWWGSCFWSQICKLVCYIGDLGLWWKNFIKWTVSSLDIVWFCSIVMDFSLLLYGQISLLILILWFSYSKFNRWFRILS